MSDFRHFAFHCQYGYLNEALKDYLCSLEIPCPQFLKTFEVSPPWKDDQNYLLQQSMLYFFRALSRKVGVIPTTSLYQWVLKISKDFDSSGRVYQQYATKWITHLELSVCIHRVISQVFSPILQTVDTLKVWLKRSLQRTVQPEGPVLDALAVGVFI